MGVRNVAAIATELQAGGLSADTPAAVIQEGTTEQQRGFRCTLGTLAETFEVNHVTSPVVYVIGEVAGL